MKALIVKTLMFSAGCLLVVAAGATATFAAPAVTPEIDGALLGSAVTLVAGGYLIIRSKRGAK
jgi:hypothetical protein